VENEVHVMMSGRGGGGAAGVENEGHVMMTGTYATAFYGEIPAALWNVPAK
jgi:hypothetical protein